MDLFIEGYAHGHRRKVWLLKTILYFTLRTLSITIQDTEPENAQNIFLNIYITISHWL
jgi:hypothetical protein